MTVDSPSHPPTSSAKLLHHALLFHPPPSLLAMMASTFPLLILPTSFATPGRQVCPRWTTFGLSGNATTSYFFANAQWSVHTGSMALSTPCHTSATLSSSKTRISLEPIGKSAVSQKSSTAEMISSAQHAS